MSEKKKGEEASLGNENSNAEGPGGEKEVEPTITFEQFISTLDDTMSNKYANIILKGKAVECKNDLEPKSQQAWEEFLTKAKQL